MYFSIRLEPVLFTSVVSHIVLKDSQHQKISGQPPSYSPMAPSINVKHGVLAYAATASDGSTPYSKSRSHVAHATHGGISGNGKCSCQQQ